MPEVYKKFRESQGLASISQALKASQAAKVIIRCSLKAQIETCLFPAKSTHMLSRKRTPLRRSRPAQQKQGREQKVSVEPAKSLNHVPAASDFLHSTTPPIQIMHIHCLHVSLCTVHMLFSTSFLMFRANCRTEERLERRCRAWYRCRTAKFGSCPEEERKEKRKRSW